MVLEAPVDPLAAFTPAVRDWFTRSFAAPTDAQTLGWPAISSGTHSLILAPTGSGKTLAAFLWALDRIASDPLPATEHRTRLLYVSPLRALAVDVERNLRAPLQGIRLAAERLGTPLHEPTVGVRTGDTPAKARRAFLKTPPDILITTPESLYLMLTSSARQSLEGVRWVIIDEIHAMAATKRGTHLAVSLERLAALTEAEPQRIGLSATQRPLEEIARFLGGFAAPGRLRPVTIVDAGNRKTLDLEVVVPVADMGRLGEPVAPEPGPGGVLDFRSGPAGSSAGSGERTSIWPAIHPRILELIRAHRSTIVFVNARRLAERVASRLNDLAEEELVKAHHGSLSREQRLSIEDELKAGRLKGLVATSSLELGIDMGAVDLVIQVASPGSVARGLQRVGRAGHHVGEPSRGKIFPKFRGDLLEAAVVVQRMRDGQIEATRYPRNPLDVLAQQIVAMCAVDTWTVDDLAALVRRAAPYADLSDAVLHNVLDLLDGRYPSEEFDGLRARIVWDRSGPGGGTLSARGGAQAVAITSGGTIPDRGLFGVFLPDGTRVGELDEEMVYESRSGDVFLLGASSWRIEEITHERVVVTPAPGQPAKMPFWRGEGPGRPLELGRAVGAFVRETRQRLDRTGGAEETTALLRAGHGLDEWAAANLVAYLDEQAEATGAVPDDQTIVVERFRDEIGDWRLCILTPFGSRVHMPWAIALEARIEERLGIVVQTMATDDGIILRLPDTSDDEIPIDEILLAAEDVRDLVIGRLHTSALFTSRFREAAARALLMPRNRPGRRTPLWQQRQRGADLLAVALRYPDFPILLEATRECVQDVFDVPALEEVLRDIAARRVRVVAVETRQPSPFARSLMMAWIAVYMYEFDSPLAERRATALALDRALLRELLGTDELRDLLDAEVLQAVERELQGLADDRRTGDPDQLHDLLRRVGDLTGAEIAARADAGAPVGMWVDGLVAQRRAILVRVGGDDRVAAADDAARLRDGLGVSIPMGLPAGFTAAVEESEALAFLAGRYARTHGPFFADDLVARFDVPLDRVATALSALETSGRLVRGEFRPGGRGVEWCDADVLRRIKNRSLAALRREVEPVEGPALARFLQQWHGIGSARRGLDALVEVLEQLQGAAIPASVLEHDVLPSRLSGYRPADLDELCAAGAVVWTGAGALGPTVAGTGDGRVVLCFRDRLRSLAAEPAAGDARPDGPLHDAIRAHLAERGASFWLDLVGATAGADESVVLAALWDLVWAGEVTNDTLAPLRALLSRRQRTPARGRPRLGRLTRLGPPAGAGRWSLVGPMLEPRPSPTELAHARAFQLLDRHGVLTRESVASEGVPGGFAGVYAVGRVLEEQGKARRGYFVSGLGAAQFALPGAVERLRTVREPAGDRPALVVLAATDPAQPYGAALTWPESGGRPARAAGAYVVLADGAAAAYLERGGRSVSTFGDAAADGLWIGALVDLVKDGRVAKLELVRIDGVVARASPWADRLREMGFVDGYKGLVLRA